jgi:hypothetical protein
MTRNKHGIEFTGNIATIRAVEDAIRATKKYTEGIATLREHHPVQGDDFPSRVFRKYYEVYPKTEVSWDMPAGAALAWLWSDVPCVNVLFFYDYRANKATMIIKEDSLDIVNELIKSIPGMRETLQLATCNPDTEKTLMGEQEGQQAGEQAGEQTGNGLTVSS